MDSVGVALLAVQALTALAGLALVLVALGKKSAADNTLDTPHGLSSTIVIALVCFGVGLGAHVADTWRSRAQTEALATQRHDVLIEEVRKAGQRALEPIDYDATTIDLYVAIPAADPVAQAFVSRVRAQAALQKQVKSAPKPDQKVLIIPDDQKTGSPHLKIDGQSVFWPELDSDNRAARLFSQTAYQIHVFPRHRPPQGDAQFGDVILACNIDLSSKDARQRPDVAHALIDPDGEVTVMLFRVPCRWHSSWRTGDATPRDLMSTVDYGGAQFALEIIALSREEMRDSKATVSVTQMRLGPRSRVLKPEVLGLRAQPEEGYRIWHQLP